MNGLVILSFLLLCLPSYSGGEEHYDVIASNNLFRPLGWVKPKRKPVFTLISTVIKDNDKYAILSDKRNNYKIVRVGDFLLGEKIVSIQSYVVETDNGTRYELERMAFLSWKARESNKKTEGRSGRSEISAKGSTEGESKVNTQTSQGTSRRRSRRSFRQRQRISSDMIEKWRNSSPEERQEMIEKFRTQRD